MIPACLAYLSIYLYLTFPWCLSPLHRVPGATGDTEMYIWNMWQQARALLDLRSPLSTDLIFHPGRVCLSVNTHVLLHGIVAAPFTLLFGPVVSVNLVLAAAFVLTALGTAALAFELWRCPFGAFLAGVIFAFCPYKMVHLWGHYNLMGTETMAPFLLLLFKSLKRPVSSLDEARRHAAWAGVLAGLTLFIDYYLFFYVMLTGLVVFLVEALLRPGKWRFLLRCSFPVFVIPALCALGMYAHAWIYGCTDVAALDTVVYTGARIYVADVASWLLPSFMHPLWGKSVLACGACFKGHAGEWTVSPGVVACLLCLSALLFALQRRRLRWLPHLLALLACGVILSLGPHPYVFGERVMITLPYALFNVLPFTRNLRVPARAGIIAVMAIALLGALGFRVLAKGMSATGRRVAALLAVSLLLFEYCAYPFPVLDCSPPPVIHALSGLPGKGTLLEFPLGFRDGLNLFGLDYTAGQLYQVSHGRPILGGMVARMPSAVIERARNDPTLRLLFALEKHERERPFSGSEILAARGFFRRSGVEAVIVHRQVRSEALLGFLELTLDLDGWREYPPGDLMARAGLNRKSPDAEKK